MEVIKKKPSEIRYSQSDIWYRFHSHVNNERREHRSFHPYRYKSRRRQRIEKLQRIGETLDELMEEECFLQDIPKIHIKWDDDKKVWISADNRRLWVFKQLERLGRCDMIEVLQTSCIASSKMSSDNDGVSVYIKDGPPSGFWHSAADAVWLDPLSIKFSTKSVDNSLKYSKDYENITVSQLKDKIKDGSITPNQIPSIIVLKTEDSYKVCDGNKRLWAIIAANKEQSKDRMIRANVFENEENLYSRDLQKRCQNVIEYYEDCSLEEIIQPGI